MQNHNGARNMRKEDVILLVQQLKTVFETVRLVDATIMTQYHISDEGEIIAEPYHCYAIWHKEKRCDNCISARALSKKSKVTKFELVNDDTYYIIAKYIEIDGKAYVLEMVSQMTYETLFGAYGQNELVESILNYNKKLYEDALTGAHNRQFYEDQLVGLYDDFAIVMLDADNFKMINDTYGHEAGDMALRTIVQTIHSCVRSTDIVVRYGGDEFLIIFKNIPREVFARKLERIRQAVEEAVVEKYPAIHLTVSMGGVSQEGRVGDLVCQADQLLYEAKIKKNNVIIQ